LYHPRPLLSALALSALLAIPTAAGALQLAGGLHVGGPVRASIALGVLLGGGASDARAGQMFVVAEPGLRGHWLSAGYLRFSGNLGSSYGLRGTALQLRSDGPARRYVGAEVHVTPLFAIGARLGAFTPVGASADRPFMWIADVMFGL
jgi:hypothetical protein